MSDFDNYLDSQLITLYLRYHDEDAFIELYGRYEELIDFFASRVYLTEYDKDDIKQVCVMAFLGAMNSYDPEKGASFKTYVRTCLKNASSRLIRDSLSTKRNAGYVVSYNDEVNIADESISYDDSHLTSGLIENDMMEVMEQLLSGLEYEIFTYFASGYSYSELAEQFRMTRKQIDNAICRARKKLSDYYSDRENTDSGNKM